MTFPSFTTGEVLTAADMNAVGLWLVKTQTIGSAVSSVVVNDAFSSTYENYKIVVSGGAGSNNTNIRLTLGASATGYSYVLSYAAYNNTAAALGGGTGSTSFIYAATAASGNGIFMEMDVIGPNLAKFTGVRGPFLSVTEAGMFVGFHQVATAYTGFTLTPGTGTLTGGTIRVYGYRN